MVISVILKHDISMQLQAVGAGDLYLLDSEVRFGFAYSMCNKFIDVSMSAESTVLA